MKEQLIKIFLFFLFLNFSGCGSAPKFTRANNTPPPERAEVDNDDNEDKEIEILESGNVSVIETETGIASFYAHKFHGRETSNGEIYDMYGISAAHPTYPEGTIIRVTNISNGKSTILKINDRMPQHPERIIDLSYGAAELLGMLEDGLAEVKVEVLKWGEGR